MLSLTRLERSLVVSVAVLLLAGAVAAALRSGGDKNRLPELEPRPQWRDAAGPSTTSHTAQDTNNGQSRFQ